ncbi:glycosyltransferase family 9 protein [bacterium]|nr:glycosyltransferase family 9 protein [bacterium]
MQIDFDEIHKILIIQYQPFGDVLLNTGYLPYLRKRFPDAKIDFLVRRPYHVVLENNPYIDELVVFDNHHGWRYYRNRLKLEKEIFGRRYDLVIDQIRGSGSAMFTLLSGAKYRLGYSNMRWKSFYNIRVRRGDNRYYSYLKFELLKPLGIEEGPHELYFHVSQESIKTINSWMHNEKLHQSRIVCFSPGSPVKRKKWNIAHYARLADLVVKHTGRQVILLWGPGEKEDAETMMQLMNTPAVMAPPTDFSQAAALLQKCELLICNDGGINHLAVAVKTPSLALFGSTNPLKWCPMHLKIHECLHNPEVNSRTDDTFGISPESAFKKAEQMLKALAPEGAGK